jgi:uncharacterized repeat protein (TIGR01451 family)
MYQLKRTVPLARSQAALVLVFLLVWSYPISSTPLQTLNTQDGPISVNLGDVFQKGANKIEPFDLSTMPSLPQGYQALNGKGYLITTAAVASGPYVVYCRVPSVTNEDDFNNLRIFHAEPDTFDPDSPVWIDRTARPEDAPAPSFSNKTINAGTEELGVFVIARLLQKIPPSTAVADLVVAATASPESVTVPSNVTYKVTVTNKGPEPATNVGAIEDLNSCHLVSATPSQGSCKQTRGRMYCKLGNLAVGAATTITVIVRPLEDLRFHPDGSWFSNFVRVAGSEKDSDTENNMVEARVLIFPGSNLPPTLTIENPKRDPLFREPMFVGPADIMIETVAIDTDGTISKVEFYDNGQPLGPGTSVDGKKFVLTARNLSFGRHWLEAFATDNSGARGSSTGTGILVNGSANVRIVNPKEGSLISPGTQVTITVRAKHPSGVIRKVELLRNDVSLGDATLVAADEYALTLDKTRRSIYTLTAVATDDSGIDTVSSPIVFRVSSRPVAVIVNPAAGTQFSTPTNLSVKVRATESGAFVTKVEFYANDRLIGTETETVGAATFMLTWRDVQEGDYLLKAVAIDEIGVTGESPIVKIKVINRVVKQ